MALADKFGGELYLCRAVQIPVGVPTSAWSLQGDRFEEFLVAHAREELEQVRAELPVGLIKSENCVVGQPPDVLCDLATKHAIDLIVIGSHGYDRLDRLLGTTAAKIVNRAPCSVTVVRDAAKIKG